MLQTWRHDRTNPQSCWFYARHLLDSRGPWTALQFMQTLGTFPDADREQRSHWLSLYVQVYGRTRDFANAAKWLAQAEALGGDDPWVLVERAALSLLEDREEDAIGAARRRSKFGPGIGLLSNGWLTSWCNRSATTRHCGFSKRLAAG